MSSCRVCPLASKPVSCGRPQSAWLSHQPPGTGWQRRRAGTTARAGVKDVSQRVAEQCDLNEKEARKVVKSTLEAIVGIVCEGEKLTLPGFGAFTPVKMNPRMVRNPRTGETYQAESKVVPRVTVSKTFKDLVKEKVSPDSVSS